MNTLQYKALQSHITFWAVLILSYRVEGPWESAFAFALTILSFVQMVYREWKLCGSDV